MPKQDLQQLFVGLQTELLSQLEVNRANIQHPGTLGDASELDWLRMLKKYLPERYQVEKAFVVDSGGSRSEQIDVVIFDRHYCPLLFNKSGALYVPAESVYAIFEAKQTVNKAMIDYASKKAASVRRLHRTSVNIPHAGGVHPPKPLFRILAGILTLDSDWNPKLDQPFKDAVSLQRKDAQLDLGCVLNSKAFEVDYEDGRSPNIKFSKKRTALIFFFLRLLHRLQQLGTVPALDIQEYTKLL